MVLGERWRNSVKWSLGCDDFGGLGTVRASVCCVHVLVCNY